MEATVWVLSWAALTTLFIWLAGRNGRKLLNRRDATSADLDDFLAPIQEDLDASRRPATHIRFVEMDQDDATTSKLGGGAYWPKNQSGPVDETGASLFLLAQIRLDQVSNQPEFPSQGLLQFFIQANKSHGANDWSSGDMNDWMQQRFFRVVYWPKLESEFDVIAAREANALPHAPTKYFRMQFEKSEELVSLDDFRFSKLYGEQGYWRAMQVFTKARGISEESLTDLLFQSDEKDATGHKLGGYPFFVQADPRTEEGMELLFQLNSDETAHIMWGDLGVANFFISPSDLKRGDFSRVLYNWDCH